jgi:hypothetical protein
MGIYNFKDQFVPDIEADRKRHTIRTKRKHPDKPGNLLYLYNRLRTKKSRRLKIRRCVKVQDIRIVTKVVLTTTFFFIFIDDKHRPLNIDEAQQLARADGFKDFYTMMEFWEGRLPFHGDLIHWESDVDAQQHEAEYSKISARKLSRRKKNR